MAVERRGARFEIGAWIMTAIFWTVGISVPYYLFHLVRGTEFWLPFAVGCFIGAILLEAPFALARM